LRSWGACAAKGLDLGGKPAYASIVDANSTVLTAAMPLAFFASGPSRRYSATSLLIHLHGPTRAPAATRPGFLGIGRGAGACAVTGVVRMRP
jgi:hypothetical protein